MALLKSAMAPCASSLASRDLPRVRYSSALRGTISGSFGSSSTRVKLKVRMPCTLTGTPLSSVGLKTHCLAASTDASRSSGWPLTTTASITFPCSDMVTYTSTLPSARAALAIAGGGGGTFLIANPFNTPPDTVRRRGLDFCGGCACAIEIVSARIQVAKLANDFIVASWSGCGHQNYSAICARRKQSWADQHKTDEFERQRTEVDRKLDYFFFSGDRKSTRLNSSH